MIRRAHHGGDFRHRHAKFLLGHDRQNVVSFQAESNTQFFQHRVVIHPTLQRQLRSRFIFAALVVDQAVQKARQNDVRAANKTLFIFFSHPGVEPGGRGFHVGERKNAHHVIIVRFQGVAQATKNIVT